MQLELLVKLFQSSFVNVCVQPIAVNIKTEVVSLKIFKLQMVVPEGSKVVSVKMFKRTLFLSKYF